MNAAKSHRPHSANKMPETAIKDPDLAASRAVENAKPEERGAILTGIIRTAIDRLESVVDKETEALRKGGEADLKAFNSMKSVGLVELNRAIQLLNGARPDASTMRLIENLNAKLEANRRVLKLHLEAVNEIAGIISDSIREADSDGTYTLSFRSKGQTP